MSEYNKIKYRKNIFRTKNGLPLVSWVSCPHKYKYTGFRCTEHRIKYYRFV